MEKKEQWIGLLTFLGMICFALTNGTWWLLFFLIGAFLIGMLLEYIFDKEKGEDFLLVVLLTIDLVKLPEFVNCLLSLIQE